jgi:hypothetical protein
MKCVRDDRIQCLVAESRMIAAASGCRRGRTSAVEPVIPVCKLAQRLSRGVQARIYGAVVASRVVIRPHRSVSGHVVGTPRAVARLFGRAALGGQKGMSWSLTGLTLRRSSRGVSGVSDRVDRPRSFDVVSGVRPGWTRPNGVSTAAARACRGTGASSCCSCPARGRSL